jgi:hypothetical protein
MKERVPAHRKEAYPKEGLTQISRIYISGVAIFNVFTIRRRP